MLDLDVVPVVDGHSIGSHDIVAQRLLEFRRHEIIARTRAVQDGKVDLEPEQVEEEWHDNQGKGSGREVLPEVGQAQGALTTVDIEESPEINGHRRSNCDERKQTDIFR